MKINIKWGNQTKLLLCLTSKVWNIHKNLFKESLKVSSINIIPQYKNIELKSIENNCCFSFEIINILRHQGYQGLGQMLTKRLRHHQGCSETPKCAYVIYGQPLVTTNENANQFIFNSWVSGWVYDTLSTYQLHKTTNISFHFSLQMNEGPCSVFFIMGRSSQLAFIAFSLRMVLRLETFNYLNIFSQDKC